MSSASSAKDSGDFDDDVPKGGGGGGGQKKSSSSSKTEDALSSLETLLGIDAGSKKTTPKEALDFLRGRFRRRENGRERRRRIFL